jgi:esterase/lipase superfamily enzyme
VKYDRYLDIPIFYGTDRAHAADVRMDPFFTGDRGTLSFGVVHVSVPDDCRRRTMAKPRWWKLQFRADPERFVTVLGVEPLDRALFIARARETLAKGTVPEALVFIHGYNVGFADAARRAAQLAYDLEFEGVTMLYSWSSEGAVLRYPVDRGNALWSLPRFRDFLTLALTALGAARVHAIAHSMGNEVLVNGLAGFDTSAFPAGAAELQEVIFAAPDVDAGQFRDVAAEFRRRAGRFTLYASSKDKALTASQLYQKYARAGQSGNGLVVVDGVDTIDATELDTGLISHSYVGDNISIVSDIFYLIVQSLPPNRRFGLLATDNPKGRYWTFRAQRP